LDEENPTFAGLDQEIGFGSAYLCTLPWLVKDPAALCTCRKECNEYGLTAGSVFLIGPSQ
jgi:hypothetical protein